MASNCFRFSARSISFDGGAKRKERGEGRKLRNKKCVCVYGTGRRTSDSLSYLSSYKVL